MSKTVLTPESVMNYDCEFPTVFLAGTIDNGNSENWQNYVIDRITEDCVIFNPRRDNWSKTATHEDVIKQIDWEQDQLSDSSVIFVNFLPKSLSPITLLELGQCLAYSACGNSSDRDFSLLVCCPKEYFRYTNVKHMCDNHGVKVVEDIDEAIDILNLWIPEY